jgi:catechol 2,3-dioxygenase-like lactoylglutathione lyase family enzyme
MMIKCINHAVVRHDYPLGDVKKFFEDFGLIVSFEDENKVYFRGTEGRPYLYVAEKSDQKGLASVAFEATSEAALHLAAERLGSRVEAIAAPWGGQQISTIDPDGNKIELVWGIEQLAALPLPRAAVAFNSGGEVRRLGRLPIFEKGPAPVLHLCHVIFGSPNPGNLIDWYIERLGAFPSDVIIAPDDKRIGAFMRFPRGKTYVDHHNVGVFMGPANSPQHICFETLDLDALQMGNRYLESKGYRASWGPVRHSLGGAISDYWLDPSGFRVEHVTDGDVLNDEYPTNTSLIGEEALMQWGPSIPEDVGD